MTDLWFIVNFIEHFWYFTGIVKCSIKKKKTDLKLIDLKIWKLFLSIFLIVLFNNLSHNYISLQKYLILTLHMDGYFGYSRLHYTYWLFKEFDNFWLLSIPGVSNLLWRLGHIVWVEVVVGHICLNNNNTFYL